MGLKMRHISWSKILFALIISMSALVTGVSIWAFLNLDRIITGNFEKYVFDITQGEVIAYADSVETLWTKRELCFSNFKVKTLSKDSSGADQVVFSSPSVRFSGLKILNLLLHKEFVLKEVNIQSPVFSENHATPSKKEEALFQNFLPTLIPGQLKSIDVKNVQIENLKLQTATTGNSKAIAYDLGKINLEIRDLLIDSTTLLMEASRFTSSDLIFTLNNAACKIPKSGEVKSKQIRFSSIEKKIKICDFSYQSETQNDSLSHWSLVIPEMLLKTNSSNWFNPSFNLHFSQIQIINPRLTAIGEMSTNNTSLCIPDSLFTLPFNKIKLDTLAVHNAAVRTLSLRGEQRFAIDSLDFRTQDITVDSCFLTGFPPENFLKRAKMKAAGFSLVLDDNQHELQIKKLCYSDTLQNLHASGIKISPLDNSDSPIAINFSTPSIGLKGFEPAQAFSHRILDLNEVELAFPHLEINRSRVDKISIMTRQDQMNIFHELVNPYLDSIHSEKLNITKGRFIYNQFKNGEKSGYLETAISFHLFDFRYDSTRFFSGNKVFLSDHFDARFSDYKMKLVDGIHILKAGQVEISSLKNQTRINQIELVPASNSISARELTEANKSALFNIQIPECTISGADYNKAWFNNDLQIQNILFNQPQITIEHFDNNQTKKPHRVSQNDLYDLFFSYIKESRVRSFLINKGGLTLLNHSKEGKTIEADSRFSFQLKNFFISPDEVMKKDRLLFADQVDIVLEDHKIKLGDNIHFIEVKEMGASTAKKEIYLKDALLYPSLNSLRDQKPCTTFLVELPELKLSGVNIASFYYNNQLFLDTLMVNRPKMAVFRSKNKTSAHEKGKIKFLLPQNINVLQMGNLILKNGKLNVFDDFKNSNHPALSSDINWSMENLLWYNSPGTTSTIEDFSINLSNLKTTLKDQVHQLQLDQLEISKQKQEITGKELWIKPNKKNVTTSSTYTIHLPLFHVKKIVFAALWEKNDVQIGSIVFPSPAIRWKTSERSSSKRINLTELNLYPMVSNFADQVKVDKIEATNASFDFKMGSKNFKSNQIDLLATGFRLSPDKKSPGLLHAKDISILKHNFSTITSNRLYEITIDEIGFSLSGKRMNLAGFRLIPLKNRYRMGRILGYQTDVLDLKIPNIYIENINWDEWLNNQNFIAQQITLSSGEMEIFRDKRLPMRKNHVIPLPQKILFNAEKAIKVDSLKILPMKLTYYEHQALTDEVSKVFFNELEGKITNITNLPESVKEDNHCRISASGQLMGTGKIEAAFDILLDHPNQLFNFQGQLNKMDLNALNSTTIPSALISVRSGKIEKMKFKVNADNDLATGQLKLFYDDLKISLINPKKRKANKFASWLANNLLIKSGNPGNLKLMFPEEIYFERDQQKSLLNYCWKAIFSGVKESFGIKNQQKIEAEKLARKNNRLKNKD